MKVRKFSCIGFIPNFRRRLANLSEGALLQCLIQDQSLVLKGKSTPTTNRLLSSPYGMMIQISKTTNCTVVLQPPGRFFKPWCASSSKSLQKLFKVWKSSILKDFPGSKSLPKKPLSSLLTDQSTSQLGDLAAAERQGTALGSNRLLFW